MTEQSTRYEVVVSNIGTVYNGEDEGLARDAYANYVYDSKAASFGREAGEDVALLIDGEPAKEHTGWLRAEHESIVFCQNDEDAAEPLRILDDQGEDAAIAFLAQWHNPGEHETSEGSQAGDSDQQYSDGSGYVLSYNLGLGYIGLEYCEARDWVSDDLARLDKEFMSPDFSEGRGYRVETSEGETIYLPEDVTGADPTPESLRDYVEARDPVEVVEVELVVGCFARLSAAGYLDCTDWLFASSRQAVARELVEAYGNG